MYRKSPEHIIILPKPHTSYQANPILKTKIISVAKPYGDLKQIYNYSFIFLLSFFRILIKYRTNQSGKGRKRSSLPLGIV